MDVQVLSSFALDALCTAPAVTSLTSAHVDPITATLERLIAAVPSSHAPVVPMVLFEVLKQALSAAGKGGSGAMAFVINPLLAVTQRALTLRSELDTHDIYSFLWSIVLKFMVHVVSSDVSNQSAVECLFACVFSLPPPPTATEPQVQLVNLAVEAYYRMSFSHNASVDQCLSVLCRVTPSPFACGVAAAQLLRYLQACSTSDVGPASHSLARAVVTLASVSPEYQAVCLHEVARVAFPLTARSAITVSDIQVCQAVF